MKLFCIFLCILKSFNKNFADIIIFLLIKRKNSKSLILLFKIFFKIQKIIILFEKLIQKTLQRINLMP